MKDFKPMLASPANLDELRYPLLASPKLDGIRALCLYDRVVSRKILDIPNRHVQACLAHTRLQGLDGELIVGAPTAEDVYRRTNSAVMSHDGEPHFTFYVFDYVRDPLLRYDRRMHDAVNIVGGEAMKLRAGQAHGTFDIRWHQQTWIEDREALDAFEAKCVAEGYEGIITRDPGAIYKYGRSTAKEQIMLKIKRFEDSEAEIVGIEEEMHNANEAQRDNLGRTKRSTAKAGKVGKGTMGALIVRDLKTGVEFNIGSGFTAADRSAEWKPGEIVKYRYFPVGVKDKPRHPVYHGRRSKIDL